MPAGSISGPIAPYSNVPINAQYYQPSVFVISAIAEGVTTTVTTTVNHNYVVGQLVRLYIPFGYGAQQLNQQTGYVLFIPAANQMVLSTNSQNIDPFLNANLRAQPQVVAVGDTNTGVQNANGPQNVTTNIPGSFINISPA